VAPKPARSERGRRGAVDARLLRYARATRSFIAASVGLGTVSALLVIAQAWLLATVVADAFAGDSLAQLRLPIAVLVSVAIARAAVAWGTQLAAVRASAVAKTQLRAALLRRVAELGPGRIGAERTGEITTLATRGIDALDDYFSLYLPQVLLAVIVPTAVLVALAASDWISAAIVVFTLPLIPVFMALVGAATRDRTAAQLRVLQRLSGHFLDVVSGLPTLKVFGAAKRQERVIAEISDRHRVATMAALRVTFLSSLVLELLSTISVALVAVEVGLRLLGGHLDLRTALFVLVVVPEAYLPLRALGANYHASAEGVAAAEQVFEVLETPPPPRGSDPDVPDPASSEIVFDEVTVTYPERTGSAIEAVSLRIEPGETVAVTGPSGCGKSTLLAVLLGFVTPAGGSVRVADRELADLDPDAWRSRLAWMPQRPHLFAGSIADNISLARPDACEQDILAAADAAGLGELLARRPGGLRAPVGERAAALSAGERQRLALARLFLQDASLVLLDEPTANLDGETEDQVLEAVRRLAHGRTVILVAHRPALVALAHRVADLSVAAVPA
jgi:ATP-binding cassette, subfamily C, bacterial CydCD